MEGFHPLKHALRFGAEVLVACTADRHGLMLEASAQALDVSDWIGTQVLEVEAPLFARLALKSPPEHVISVARRPPRAVRWAAQKGPLVVLEAPSHLGNIGAVIRVAAAAEAAGVVTLGGPDPWHPACLRGAAGLHFALPVERMTLEELPNWPIMALDPAGGDVGALSRDLHQTILAFGSESHGISKHLKSRARGLFAIPMRPGVSSLNLATAVAITLYR